LGSSVFRSRFDHLIEESTEDSFFTLLHEGGRDLGGRSASLEMIENVATVHDAADADQVDVVRQMASQLPDLSEGDRLHGRAAESCEAAAGIDARLAREPAPREGVRKGVAGGDEPHGA